jgi:Skp family chaperone for outer membrane proteins
VDTLRQSYESLKLSSELEKQYGSERASVEQKHIEALQEAWRYMSEQVKLGMDATEANEMYLDSAKAITAEYELQLGLLEEQSKLKRGEALQEASKAIAGVVGQRALVGASDAQKTQARIDEQVYAFAESLTQGGANLKDTLDKTTEYRRQLEMLAAEEARQAVWDGIKSQWEGTGDVGMISGWVDAFKDGGPMAGIAKVATDLLTRFESVNELLSIVTKFIEYVALR